MRKIRIVLPFFVMFFYHSANAYDTKFSTNQLTINIVAPELKPLIYRGEKGQSQGVMIDVLNEVSNKTILNIHVTVLPWARAMIQVLNGQVDAIMPAFYTKSRLEKLDFPEKALINFNGSVLIKRSNDKFEFTSFDDIQGIKAIAKVRAVLMREPFESAKNKSNLKIVEVRKLEDALNMLLLDRVDLVIADAHAAYS